MSQESKMTPQEQSTIEVIVKMSENLSNHAKMSLLEDIFNTLDKNAMVDFTDFCNSRMQDVITHKAEIAGRMLGKKAGELFSTSREKINGLSNQFSQKMGKFRGDKDNWSDTNNPYDESNPK